MLQALSIFTVGIIGVFFGIAVIYTTIKGTTRLTMRLERKEPERKEEAK